MFYWQTVLLYLSDAHTHFYVSLVLRLSYSAWVLLTDCIFTFGFNSSVHYIFQNGFVFFVYDVEFKNMLRKCRNTAAICLLLF